MEELQDSVASIWRFVLERAVHEFNNSAGGILSVSETHLSRQIDDPELRQSLELIQDSARASSDFVAAIVDLLAAEEGSPELTRLSDLREYLQRKLTLFLPRRIRLATPPCIDDTMVKVSTKLLLFNLLALLQNELREPQPATLALELGLKVEGAAGWLVYRSIGRTGPPQTKFCRALFSKMKPPLAIDIQEKASEFEVSIGFATVKGR